MKKRLLNEAEIRKLMKFANLGALTENFVDQLEEAEMEEDLYEQEGEEDLDDLGDEGPPVDAAPADDAPLPDEEGEELDLDDAELGADDDPVDADPEAVESAVRQILDVVMDSVEELFGEAAPEMSVEEPDEEGEEDLGDLGDLGGEEDLGDLGDLGGEEDLGDLGDVGTGEDEDLEDLAEELGPKVATHKGKDVKQLRSKEPKKSKREKAMDTEQYKKAQRGEGEFTIDEPEVNEDIFLEDESLEEDMVNEIARRVARRLMRK